jgi:hypothetical protein
MWCEMKLLRLTLISVLVLSVVSLACNLGLQRSTPQTSTVSSPTSVPINGDELMFDLGESEKEDGKVTLVLNEAQLTEIVVSELQDVEGISIRDIQVILREGQVQVFGDILYQGISANSRIFLVPQVDLQGQPRFVIVSAYYSLFPIPDDIVANLQVSIDQIFQNYFEPLTMEVFIERISISEGLMTLTGREK